MQVSYGSSLISVHVNSRVDVTPNQGSYTLGKCQRIFYFFKVRELSANFMMCQGKMKFCQNVRELSGNFAIPVMNAKKRLEQF